MTTGLPRCFACFVVALWFIPVLAGDPKDPDTERLIRQLGSDQFPEREQATKRLKEIGEPALAALKQATTSDDLEVRRRAENLIATIEDKLYGEQLRFTAHAHDVWSVALSADGKCLLTSGDDNTLRLWDADTGKQVCVFEGHTERVQGAALSADGKRVLSGSYDKTVRLWDATTGKELQKLTGHTSEVVSVAFGPQDKALSGSVDGQLGVWDLNSGKTTRFLHRSGSLDIVTYSDQAKLAAASSMVCGALYLWDLETGKRVRTIDAGVGPTGQRDTFNLTSISFSPDGKQLLVAQEHDEAAILRIWDVKTGRDLKRIPAHQPRITSAAFSPDGKRIVSGGADGVVRVWEVETGNELRIYEGHTAAVNGVAFFPDGKRIASASSDGTVRIWGAPK